MFLSHSLRVAGAAECSVVADESAAVEVVNTRVHEHHAVLTAGLDERFEHVLVVFADDIPNGGIGDEQFICKNAAAAVDGREEILSNDALKCVGELQNDLTLSAAFENADDAFKSVSDIR